MELGRRLCPPTTAGCLLGKVVRHTTRAGVTTASQTVPVRDSPTQLVFSPMSHSNNGESRTAQTNYQSSVKCISSHSHIYSYDTNKSKSHLQSATPSKYHLHSLPPFKCHLHSLPHHQNVIYIVCHTIQMTSTMCHTIKMSST